MRGRVQVARAVALALGSCVLARLPPRRLAAVLRLADRDESPDVDARAVAERALALSGHLIRHTCYTRGITRYLLLRPGRHDLLLVFGMDAATREGHCWILLDGKPYLEAEDPAGRFVPVWQVGG